MSAKIELSAGATHSPSAVSSILSDYTTIAAATTLVSSHRLNGGYSGRSYRVHLSSDRTYVLKVVDGYTLARAELMCRTAHRLGRACGGSSSGCDLCLPVPRTAPLPIVDGGEGGEDTYEFVSLKEENGVPAFLLSYSPGVPADVVLRETPRLTEAVMEGIGAGLAGLHSATAGITPEETKGLRWYKKDGGCCDLQDQIDGVVLRSIEKCPDAERRDGFLDGFYRRELEALRETTGRSSPEMELGITHGDPFSDNVLVDPETGELESFVDIEDACVGPLLFDLCCCAVGCCFRAAVVTDGGGSDGGDGDGACPPQELDAESLAALLRGYRRRRTLPAAEREEFVGYLRLTLLCNCSWRFVRFNCGEDVGGVPQEARDSYRELEARVEHLHDPEVVGRIETLLEEYA